MPNMREKFIKTAVRMLEADPKVVLVLAEISVSAFNDLDLPDALRQRIINVGIREQLLISVAAGLAKEGFLPIVHTYAPFLVERAYEQLKLDFSHQGLAGIFVSIGASYDAASSGRTHQAPADVGLIAALPDWDIYVPGHGDEVETFMHRAATSGRCSYIRLSEETNRAAIAGAPGKMSVVKESAQPVVVIAVGPMLEPVLAAVEGFDLGVLYAPSIHPFDSETLRACRAEAIVLVEPYLAGTSAALVSAALLDQPHRLLALGVRNMEFRHYGLARDHAAHHGLDENGLRQSIGDFLSTAYGRLAAI